MAVVIKSSIFNSNQVFRTIKYCPGHQKVWNFIFELQLFPRKKLEQNALVYSFKNNTDVLFVKTL